jgi:Spy/CpxP family protein refolding chaperone
MNPNQKIFVFGSVGLLAFSLFLGSLHSDEGTFGAATAVAATPAIAAPAEPVAETAAVEEAAIELVAVEEAAPEAAPEADSAIEAALKAEAALSPAAPADAGSEPIAVADAPAAAPADAASPDCAKGKANKADCKKGKASKADCDKGKADCKKGKADCDKGKADCDKGAKSCNKASGCAGGHCVVGGIACGLACKVDLTDEQQASIDTIVAGYRAEAASLGSSKKQAKQELRALWEASPIKPAAIQKKAAQADALGLAKRAATTKAKLDLAGVLTAGQYDSVDHLFSACDGKGKSGKGGAHIASADCAGGSCKR